MPVIFQFLHSNAHRGNTSLYVAVAAHLPDTPIMIMRVMNRYVDIKVEILQRKINSAYQMVYGSAFRSCVSERTSHTQPTVTDVQTFHATSRDKVTYALCFSFPARNSSDTCRLRTWL